MKATRGLTSAIAVILFAALAVTGSLAGSTMPRLQGLQPVLVTAEGAEPHNIIKPEYATIAGAVTMSPLGCRLDKTQCGGKIASAIQVKIYDASGRILLKGATSDGAGRFFVTLPPGIYTVYTQCNHTGNDCSQPVQLTIAPGATQTVPIHVYYSRVPSEAGGPTCPEANQTQCEEYVG